MKRGPIIKFAAVASVQLLLTVAIVVIFGELRFEKSNSYSAEFANATGLRAGQFVRIAGVEVGKVSKVELTDGDRRVVVRFSIDSSMHLYESTTAHIRYQDMVGNRYLELGRGQGDDRVLPPGGFIPLSRTEPALDLDALIGGFRPLFRALDPQKVNAIASSIVTVFQGEGGTINNILDQTAQLTGRLAERDEAIGEVIINLNTVLDTTVKHRKEFDATVNNLEVLITGLKQRAGPLAAGIAHISQVAGTLGDLLTEDRPVLHDTVNHFDEIATPLVAQQDQIDDLLTKWPKAFTTIGRFSGTYGDFFNFYLCDLSIKVNGLQPGGPVRTVKLYSQPTGRCTPQ